MWLGVGRQDEERLFGKLARICLEGCRSHEFDGPDEELEVDLFEPTPCEQPGKWRAGPASARLLTRISQCVRVKFSILKFCCTTAMDVTRMWLACSSGWP